MYGRICAVLATAAILSPLLIATAHPGPALAVACGGPAPSTGGGQSGTVIPGGSPNTGFDPSPPTQTNSPVPPSNVSNPAYDPSKQPTKMPSTGGGAGDGTHTGDASGSDSSSGGFDTSGGFAFVGSAPGLRGHGTLLMLALGSHLNQAVDPCVPITSAPAPIPCPPAPAAPRLPNAADIAGGIAIAWPSPQVHVTPDLGLVALPEWYWLTGYDGGPIQASTHIHLDGLPNPQAGCPSGPAADEDVAVQAVATSYNWSFGDSTTGVSTTSLGVPYPDNNGAIHHAYQDDSGKFPDGYQIRVTAHWTVRYQANGGGWQTFETVDRTWRAAHKVQQAAPVLVSNR